MLHQFHCFYEDFFLPFASPTSIRSVTEFIKPVCNSLTPFRSMKVLFIIRNVLMAAFFLSSSNLTLRQIRLGISEKKKVQFPWLSLILFIWQLANIFGIQYIMCFPALLNENTNLNYCTHLWGIIHIIMFPFILSIYLIFYLLIYHVCKKFPCSIRFLAELWTLTSHWSVILYGVCIGSDGMFSTTHAAWVQSMQQHTVLKASEMW